MTQIQTKFTNDEVEIIDIVKATQRLKSKSEALKYIVNAYGDGKKWSNIAGIIGKDCKSLGVLYDRNHTGRFWHIQTDNVWNNKGNASKN